MRIPLLLSILLLFTSIAIPQNPGKENPKHIIKSQTQLIQLSTDEHDTALSLTIKNGTTFYNKNGNVTRDETYNRDGSITNLYQYEYNAKSKVIKLTTDGNIFRYAYDAKDSLVKYETYGKDDSNLEEVRTYTYIHDGKAVPKAETKKGNVTYISIINILDSANRLISIKTLYESGYDITTISYDNLGRPVLEKETSDADGDETTKFFYTNGKLSKKIIDGHGVVVDYYNEKGQLIKKGVDGRVELNKYDKDGNLTSTVQYDAKGQVEGITRYTYEYY